MKYIKFNKNEQISFMRLVKYKTKLTWEKLAQYLEISRSMIFFYLDASSKIPYINYKKLCALAKIRTDCNSFIEIKNKTEKIKNPRIMDNNLAELIGIIAGDGHISKINYEVSSFGTNKISSLISWISCPINC